MRVRGVLAEGWILPCQNSIRILSRVGTGSYPPVAPTDPELPDLSIRLLGLWIRYASVEAMDKTF